MAEVIYSYSHSTAPTQPSIHTLRRKYSKKQDVGQFKESNDNKGQQYEWLYIEGDKRGHFSLKNSLAPWAMLFILLPSYNRLDMGSKFCRHVHNV